MDVTHKYGAVLLVDDLTVLVLLVNNLDIVEKGRSDYIVVLFVFIKSNLKIIKFPFLKSYNYFDLRIGSVQCSGFFNLP